MCWHCQAKDMLTKDIALIKSKIISEKKRALELRENNNDRAGIMIVMAVCVSLCVLLLSYTLYMCLPFTGALRHMRRKVILTRQVEQRTSQLLLLDDFIVQLEASKAIADAFHSMRSANAATRATLRNARMEELGQLPDLVQAAQDDIARINDVVRRSIDSAQEPIDYDRPTRPQEPDWAQLDTQDEIYQHAGPAVAAPAQAVEDRALLAELDDMAAGGAGGEFQEVFAPATP